MADQTGLGYWCSVNAQARRRLGQVHGRDITGYDDGVMALQVDFYVDFWHKGHES